jgi:hypothetical protein
VVEDEVVVAAAALDEGKDKARDAWEGQPPGRAVSVFARPVDIASRTLLGCPAPAKLAPSVAQR